ncbi:HAD family hydrolase [Candidatus Woesearchaeota archaeon]|nr:HAD family hydrolase [Candidatus Woesearchaeota archaeon]
MGVKAVLFDFWGTLIENGTYSPLKQSYAILRLRVPFGEYVERFEKALMTKKFDDQKEGFKEVCDEFNVPAKPFIIDKLIGVWNKNKLLAKPFPDTIAALEMLKNKGIKAIIISNAPQDSVQQILEKFNLAKYFDSVFVSSDYGELKVQGLFDVLLDKTGLKKDEVVMVGDSLQSDIAGAEKHGIKAILIDRKDRQEYKNKISRLTQLEGIL